MKYKAVIFDLDGTLLDTLEDIADSMNLVLQDRGFPTHPLEAYVRFIGSGAGTLVSRALPPEQRNDELAATCLEEFRKVYNSNWNNKTRPYDGITELLDALTSEGIRMAVLSNKPQHFTDLCMQEYFSDWKFEEIAGQKDGIPIKPDPNGALGIAELFDIPASEFLFLGDSDIDMITAVNTGMYPVGASWGFRSEKELLASGAGNIINLPMELLGLFS